jgi:hypothetical protein
MSQCHVAKDHIGSRCYVTWRHILKDDEVARTL